MTSAQALLWCLAVAGLWLQFKENRRLVGVNSSTRSRCAGLLRHVRRQRDAYASCLEDAGDEYQELREQHEELRRETDAYRSERIERRAWN